MHHPVLAAAAIGLSSLAYTGCQTEEAAAPHQVAFSSFANSEWSAPVNLGPPINSLAGEQNAFLAKDGLTLYFSSDRTGNGAQGSLDIWVSERATRDEAWGAPENVTALNSPGGDLAPNVSADGHLVFFTSNRPGSIPVSSNPGAALSVDVWMSRRTNVHDPHAWEVPVRLGPGVNTASSDQAPMYLQNAEAGATNLYFNRGLLQANLGDIYSAVVTRRGEVLGDAAPVRELNSPANEAAAMIRHDGREIFFWSVRPGSVGPQDLWTSTREEADDPWSGPELATRLNSAANDFTPNLSFDGQTMIFSSNRPAPTLETGGNDLWISTRTPSGE
jgi:hypothetical protein